MNQEDRETEHEWALKMIALEEERGPIVPGGAVGGVAARTRRAAERKAAQSASKRARGRVRFVALAVPAPQEQAA